jgi:hypothetical protein
MATKKPSTKTSTRALEGPRRLTKEIPSFQGVYDVTNVFPSMNGWYNDGLTNLIAYETYFDLSGYELDDMTFVPTGVLLQDPGRYIADNATLDYEVLDIVSQEKLSLTNINAQLTLGNVPGMAGTTQDFTQIVAGNYRLMTQQTTTVAADLLLTINGGSFGSGEPTAAAKLWVYRIIRVNGLKIPGNTLNIPGSRFVMNGTVIKEEELPYMMRLKRSYEIATQG